MADHFHRIADHRQRAQAQQVHLQKTDLFDAIFVKLGGDEAIRRVLDRHLAIQRILRNHQAGGMRGGVARQPLQRHGQVKNFTGCRFGIIGIFQIMTHGHRIFQGDVQHCRHQFGNPVHFAERYVQSPADIPDGGAGGHRSESDDLGHMVGAIARRDIFDDLPPPDIAEVDVNIRHGDAFRIQKPFEQQAVLQRINIRDLQQVGHNASRRGATPRPHWNP